MTDPTTDAPTCGHPWPQVAGDGWWHGGDHTCAEPASHHPAVPHTCRCGATTTREDT